MPNESSTIVQRLWNYCNVLRDDGVSYGDYVEQLTYLLFLKMADEQTKAPFNKPSTIPKGLDWQSLLEKDGDKLETHYRHILETLGKGKGMLGVIFRKSQNKIQDPAKLRRLVELINGETWMGLDIDVKGDIYEGLLQKNAEDIKSGAGQYFTPRPLIKAMVEVIKPQAGMTICDPACGTGGFLLAAHDYISKHSMDKEQKKFLRFNTFRGYEIVDNAARLCVMNLYLHGIGGEESPIIVTDTLASDPGDRFDRKETERFRAFTYNELMQRDKISLDVFWLKDESLEDSENLPEPDVIARDIAENLESAVEQFTSIYEVLGEK